jgi:hypothetical protein
MGYYNSYIIYYDADSNKKRARLSNRFHVSYELPESYCTELFISFTPWTHKPCPSIHYSFDVLIITKAI